MFKQLVRMGIQTN